MNENLIFLKDEELKENCLLQLYEDPDFQNMFDGYIADNLKDTVLEDFTKDYNIEFYDLDIDVEGGSASITFSEGVLNNIEELVADFGNDSEYIDISNVDSIHFDDEGLVWEIYLKDNTIEYDDDFKYDLEEYIENTLETFLDYLEREISKHIDKLEDCDIDILFDIIRIENWNISINTEEGCVDGVNYW